MQAFARNGVSEAEGAGMKGLAWQERKAIVYELFVFSKHGAFENAIAAIGSIAKQGMTNGAHMYAYLVGAACFEFTFHEGNVIKAFNNAVMGDGGFAGFAFVVVRIE